MIDEEQCLEQIMAGCTNMYCTKFRLRIRAVVKTLVGWPWSNKLICNKNTPLVQWNRGFCSKPLSLKQKNYEDTTLMLIISRQNLVSFHVSWTHDHNMTVCGHRVDWPKRYTRDLAWAPADGFTWRATRTTLIPWVASFSASDLPIPVTICQPKPTRDSLCVRQDLVTVSPVSSQKSKTT